MGPEFPGTVAGCGDERGDATGRNEDALKAVRVVDVKGRVVDIPAGEIPFSYQRAHLPRGIVAGVWLQMKPGDHARIEKTVKDYLQYRKDTSR